MPCMSILTDGTGFGAAVNFLWMVMLSMELLCNIIGAGHVQIHKSHTRFFQLSSTGPIEKNGFRSCGYYWCWAMYRTIRLIHVFSQLDQLN